MLRPSMVNNDGTDVSVNPHLVNLVHDFQKDLWPREYGPVPDASWYERLQKEPGEEPHRMHSVPITWHPVYCKTAKVSWKLVQVLRKGNSNSVSLVKEVKTGREMILKVYSNPEEYTLELNFLMVANHPLIVRPICYIRIIDRPNGDEGTQFSYPALLLENVPGRMNAQEYVACCASEADMKRITAQLLVVTEYMHWLGYLHGDLKPSNVMVDSTTKSIVLTDFGFTTRIEHCRKGRGTPATTSPEVAYRHPGRMHEGSQWWSIGVTLGMLHGMRLLTIEAERRADDARDDHPEANIEKYFVSPEGIRESRSGGAPSEESIEEEDSDGEKAKVTHYVPIGIHGQGYERHPTPSGFSPALRHFLFHFFALDGDQRIFNTPRLLQILYRHPYLRDAPWADMPSPLLKPALFHQARKRVRKPTPKHKESIIDRRLTPIEILYGEESSDYREDL